MRKEKNSNSKGGLKNLVKYMKKHSLVLVLAVLFAIGGSVITVYSPDKLSEMTDIITQGIIASMNPNLAGGINMDKVYEIGITLAVLYGISVLLSYSQNFIMATVTQKTTKQIRTDIS